MDKLFRFGLIWKAVEGVFQTLLGIVLLITGGLFALAIKLSQHELIEDPRDKIANWFIGLAGHFSVSTQAFIAIYILIHGIVKIFLSISLWKDKKWAYPIAIVMLGLLALYQIYRITHTHSIILGILTVIDFGVIWIIWKEWKK